MAMFIHGFWFGASLVRKGTISAGDIMFVFWACSIATSNLQLCTSQLIILSGPDSRDSNGRSEMGLSIEGR